MRVITQSDWLGLKTNNLHYSRGLFLKKSLEAPIISLELLLLIHFNTNANGDSWVARIEQPKNLNKVMLIIIDLIV